MPGCSSFWDRAKIEKLLRDNDRAVERAMIVLCQRQTADEQTDAARKIALYYVQQLFEEITEKVKYEEAEKSICNG